MRIKSTLTAIALGLAALTGSAWADENPLLDRDFWKEADLAQVQAAVEAGADVTAMSTSRFTPLHRALYSGASEEIVDFLIENGADIERLGHDGRPAIMWAARGSDVDMIKKLIDMGADPFFEEASGRSVAAYAGYGQSDVEVFKYLFEEVGLDPEHTDMGGRHVGHNAVYYNQNLDVVQYLSTITDMNLRDEKGWNGFLLSAYRNKNIDVVKWAFENLDGHDVTDYAKGANALHWAAYRGTMDSIQFLIENGFDPLATSGEGRDALSYASQRQGIDTIQFFADQGGDFNATGDKGRNALHHAMARQKPEVVDFLLEQGMDVNLADNEGNTALLLAAQRDRRGVEDIVVSLMAAGADASATNEYGVTTLLAAARANHSVDMLKAFIDGGADVNARDRDDMSALMYVAMKGKDPAALDLLLDAGADASFEEAFGDTAAILASENEALKDSAAAARLASN